MNRFARIVFILLIGILLSVGIARPLYAQDQPGWYDQGYAESIQSAQSGDVNAAAHVSNVNTNNYSDSIRRILGPVPGITTTETGMTPYNKQLLGQSAVFNIATQIDAIYNNPPASTYAFIQDMGQTLGFIPKQTYAQGIGFSGLSALLPIWKAFRNVAYLCLALVMVVIGFFVMFRKKIDPKTVVTVQSALPRIIVTLILITFSYAIVGILIDVMYLLIALILGLFQSTGLLGTDLNPSQLISKNLVNTVFDTVKITELPYRLLGIPSAGVGTSILIGTVGTALGIAAVSTVLAAAPLVGVGIIVASWGGILVAWIIGFFMLLLCLRLFIYFITAYIKIIMALLFGPIQLLLAALPGNDAFGSWFKNLISQILIFPVSAIMFLLASIFMRFAETATTRLWVPPYVGFASANTTSISTIIALGILWAIPSVGKQIQEALKAKSPINAGVGGIAGVAGTAGQYALQYYMGKKQLEQQMRIMGQGWTNPADNKTVSGGPTGGKDPHGKK